MTSALTSLMGFGLNDTPVIIGGGRTIRGVVVVSTLMLFEATQLTLRSPSRTLKRRVETVSQAEISVSTAEGVTLASVELLMSHCRVGRGFPGGMVVEKW